MRLIIVMILSVIIIQLIGFQMQLFSNLGDDKIWYWYCLCDSVSWTIISLTSLRLTKQIKIIGQNERFVRRVKIGYLFCQMFFVLTICPLVNDLAGEGCNFLKGNYIYGGLVILYYALTITFYSVKIYQNGEYKK